MSQFEPPELLGDEELQKILEHLAKTQDSSGCLRCGHTKYALKGPLALTYSNVTVFGGHPTLVRLAALSCANCGNTELIDLDVVGL